MKEARVKEIYEELGKLVIELSRDPVSLGPRYLQDLISRTRGYLNQTSFYLTEVLRERHHHEMELETLEAAFQVASDELMASDRRVTSLPAIQDRTSMINVLLAKERKAILAERRILKDLGHVERVVRHRHKELENTMSAVRLQRSLIETEIRTGAAYGDESDQSRGSLWGKSGAKAASTLEEDMSEEDLDRLMQQAEEELDDGSAATTESEPTADVAPAPAPLVSTGDDFIDLLEEAEQLSASALESSLIVPVAPEPPSPPKVPAAQVAQATSEPAVAAESDDPDISRFLAQGSDQQGESDDSDLFRGL